MAGTLYLCATPIGNLEDMTFRAVRILKEVDLIAAEDTRNSIKLLNHFEIKTPMTSYHEYNKIEKGHKLVERLLYYNECLVVEADGQLVIAESFTKEEYCLKEVLFKNVYRGGLTFKRTFPMSEVLYFRLNNKNIRQLLSNLCAGYTKILEDAVD